MNREEMKRYSGEESYKRPMKLDLDEISLQGSQGVFVRTAKPAEKGGEWLKTTLGTNLKGTFLRVRRKYVDLKKKLTTSEHNGKSDNVVLFTPVGQQRGIADDIRKNNPTLRTCQVVYFLLDNTELVKLLVRGASLGSENKPKESIPFYDYLASFSGDEHVWEYETELVATPETGKLGPYYATSFKRSKKLSDLELDIVGDKLKLVHDAITSQDEFYKTKNLTVKKTETDYSQTRPEEEEATIVLDTEPQNEIDAVKVFENL